MADPLNNGGAPAATTEEPLRRFDRRALAVLLAASCVTMAFLLAAMYRENFQSEWRKHQRAYRALLAASPDENQRRLAASFAVELRQIDVPALGATDRCVSCHVGLDNPATAGSPQPYCPHSGDYLKHHPVEKYGCTICHRGQGAATAFREAKASDVYWDYPMLPVGLTQASCGACHAADSTLMAKHAPKLARGRELFIDRGCQSCHKLGGVGGQLGPALDGVGMKIKHQLPMAGVKGEHTLANWLNQHFASPQGIVANSQMRPPRLTPAENEALTVYMLSLQNRDLPQNYTPADRVAAWDSDLHHKTKDPAVLYNRFCASCHGDGTYGRWDKFFKRFIPAVRGPGLRALADEAYLRAAIEQGRPGTLMPAWNRNAGGLTPEQVTLLTAYLSAGDGRPPQKLQPSPEPLAGGDAVRGGELFTQHCSACHRGANRLAPALENPAFQKSASDRLIVGTICNGRKDTAMPSFRRAGADCLTDGEIRDLLAHVRSLGKQPGTP
jgi:mono/diheme cytochrome c family protein